MPKPAFVLLHGAWHSAACWDHVKELLLADNYRCISPSLPSTGSESPITDLVPDVEVVRSSVTELLSSGLDVVVVSHSYSGIPAGEALEGLDKQSRAIQGHTNAVVRLVYISSFLVPEGFQHSARGTRENMIASMKTDLKVGSQNACIRNIC
jgi:pimeloyl-ACP methyl ester carboxylesterase